ncbi:hypothetical protein HGRIS_009934 [Hohenbuehelia grisea]|uniref:GAR domain-containing protein n=1 Tax=Hohenbuehelia grisea TaxID=104357 RepID=A0ABR3J2N4_9AGAR
MTAVMVTPSTESGTLPVNDTDAQLGEQDSLSLTEPSAQNPAQQGDEQALESHEVIELQAFIERKAWIEEKIQVLGRMPPVEVFAGMEAVRASAEEVPGLPSRDELQRWMVEHDAIEKETEIFDAGEMQKLKKFTKAATQRNLSPEDTDLIELTLTVIYDLDKLMHLLRDRSENLELLGIRLSWEEYRCAAWSDIRGTLAEFKHFLETRAHWTPSIYDTFPRTNDTQSPSPPIPSRRGSVASIASVASVLSESSATSPGLSRANRYKLAEQVARDAAQVSSRLSGLRQGKIAAAGKALDKLIDSSRKPVPDEILDEQDRLEERGISELEPLGKFLNGAILQWRKADETYVETMKDQASAQNLIEELELAKLHHPNPSQSLQFFARLEKLRKRLALRSDPAAPGSIFPCPVHPLFPEQKDFNDSLINTLHTEIVTAIDLVKNVDALAKEYGDAAQCVQDADDFLNSARDLIKSFTSIVSRLQDGVPAQDDEGTPPLLTSDACLQPNRHSTFLALLPSFRSELDEINPKAQQLQESSTLTILRLDKPGVDPDFRSTVASEARALQAARDHANQVSQDVSARASRLREVRRIGACVEKGVKDMADMQRRLGELLERSRWRKPEETVEGVTSTPDSLQSISLPSPISFVELTEELNTMDQTFAGEVEQPLGSLSSALDAPLSEWFLSNVAAYKSSSAGAAASIGLLQSVQAQATVMHAVREEYNGLQSQLDDEIERSDLQSQVILATKLSDEDLDATETNMNTSTDALRTQVRTFVDGLTRRVPFIGHPSPQVFPSQDPSGSRRSYSEDLTTNRHGSTLDIQTLDASIRSECNHYAMRLHGSLQNLEQKKEQFQAARLALSVDNAISATLANLIIATDEISLLKDSLPSAIDDETTITMDSLQTLSKQLESALDTHHSKISPSFPPIRELLQQMDGIPAAREPSFHQNTQQPRIAALSDAETKFRILTADVDAFRARILQAQQIEARRLELEALELERLEKERLEQDRLAEERRVQAEQEKARAEEAEARRLEREQKELEERLKLEEERRQLQIERERILAEEAHHAKMEEERLAALEQLKLEGARLAAERRQQLENERLSAELAERERIERERLAAEEKSRLEAERLAEETRLRLEKEQIASEKAHLEREQSDFAEKLRTEEERLASERQLHAEKERAMSEESLRLTQEREAADKAKRATASQDVDDVFGFQVASSSKSPLSQELSNLKAQILALRKRIRNLSISDMARPTSTSARLPNVDRVKKVVAEFSTLQFEVEKLPQSTGDTTVDVELKSLRSEVQGSMALLDHVRQLGDLMHAVQACDAAFSDLLEHIDSYPAPPLGILSSGHTTVKNTPPEDQMAARLDFTQRLVDDVAQRAASVRDDARATAERTRITQTWAELEEMARDRMMGQKSRPGSVLSVGQNSSGRNSSSSVVSNRPAPSARKSQGYSSLSLGPSSRGRFLTPSAPATRRVVSGGHDSSNSRSSSRLPIVSSNRSVSGPMNPFHASTFSARQRTSSLSTTASTPSSRTPMRSRAQTGQSGRIASPAMSDASFTPSLKSTGRSGSTFGSTWSRAPRLSLSKGASPHKTPTAPKPKKTYVPNPKSKLDVAVGDVLNKLPVNITVEGISETWRDQSGKYWIGDQDPKLCFCRILRSHTVMVRVGGGWAELSKFIRDHFADSFRLLPESPHRHQGAQEEKWISSTTLLEKTQTNDTPLTPPRTPEPRFPFVPSFALSTPSGGSPHSVKSSPSTKGSPLTPLQFMRRAEPEAPFLRPSTPTKASGSRTKRTMPPTPARNSIWRP